MPIIAAIAVVGLVGLVGTLLVGWRPPAEVGDPADGLAPCPGTPNCVNSLSTTSREAIEPFHFEGSPDEAMTRLRQALDQMPRMRVAADTGQYIHAVARTPSYLFADDLEFLLDENNRKIDLRSASRVGYGDGEVNRTRVEELRRLFEVATAP